MQAAPRLGAKLVWEPSQVSGEENENAATSPPARLPYALPTLRCSPWRCALTSPRGQLPVTSGFLKPQNSLSRERRSHMPSAPYKAWTTACTQQCVRDREQESAWRRPFLAWFSETAARLP